MNLYEIAMGVTVSQSQRVLKYKIIITFLYQHGKISCKMSLHVKWYNLN